MPQQTDIIRVLQTIPDPEMPISIVDLGLVHTVRVHADERDEADHAGALVEIDLLPTFVGCPALDMIADQVRAKVGQLPDVSQVKVNWIFDPPWSVDRISDAGRASLREHGVTVPDRKRCDAPHHASALDQDNAASGSAAESTTCTARGVTPPFASLRIDSGGTVRCPFCNSTSTYLDSPFGPTRCRTIYYCESCRNSFEHMKRV